MPHGFERIVAHPERPDHSAERAGDTIVARLRLDGWHDVSVRMLHPFTWDAKFRGFRIDELAVSPARPRTLVSGAYSVADAAALNVDAAHGTRTPFDFPEGEMHDGVLYRTVGHSPEADERYQDAAGWCTVAAADADGRPVALATALDRSEAVLLDLLADDHGLTVQTRLPWQTFRPAELPAPDALPGLLVRHGHGDHETAEAWLRELLAATVPSRASTAPPPLIADTWGFGTDIDPERVTAFFDVAADLGVEVVTVDKGWEDHVGDWNAQSGYAGGVAGIAALAHDRGMKLGLWVGAGNASPDSVVATAHPDWLATWNGRHQMVSHRNHSLCLGHEPARDHVLACLDRLVRDGVDWLLHDFETISRCDAEHHTHDPGAGEAAGVTGWYSVLAALREAHPNLLIENCWNGGKPLDLQMIAHHDTTIGDDWCRSQENRLAALGLGVYLPSSWTSKYMGDEPHLPLRAQLAPYLVGGPWILMGDLPGWAPAQLAEMRQGIAIYREWRTAAMDARAVSPVLSGSTAGVTGLAHSPRAHGAQLATFAVSEAGVGQVVRWRPVLDASGAADVDVWIVRDEWSGAEQRVARAELDAGIPLNTASADGLALSIRPA
ncbi:glycoside hydrolase family 36 protein [Microcella humidisoli]|uniref:Alpha-galactosidase n=1 Tax=Microcella humidisoli TaxID=2963406 RepID=A0ABY5FXT6_9MICO|nr:glycoside hydrolase family 36 protein [Microcella humidisoli]UTT62883.1 alpha-galactosidase [Microcella humidisoli]